MRFGEFEADLATGELYRSGVKVKIQDLPFRVLAALLERGGEVVTRDELRNRLWGSETFVDAEAGLNTAIAKLREALGDRAESPRFVETLPKRGYRFIGEIAPAGAGPATPPASAPSRRWRALTLAAVLGLALATLAGVAWRVGRPEERVVVAVVLFHNETGENRFDRLAQQLTDGTVVALAADPRLAVIGNAAVLRTPRIFTDLQKIGAALAAEYLVLGQLQGSGDELVVRAHFVRVSDQTHLWAGSISGSAEELDDRVAETVAAAVKAVVGDQAMATRPLDP